jgi:hypothetical protein
MGGCLPQAILAYDNDGDGLGLLWAFIQLELGHRRRRFLGFHA